MSKPTQWPECVRTGDKESLGFYPDSKRSEFALVTFFAIIRYTIRSFPTEDHPELYQEEGIVLTQYGKEPTKYMRVGYYSHVIKGKELEEIWNGRPKEQTLMLHP